MWMEMDCQSSGKSVRTEIQQETHKEEDSPELPIPQLSWGAVWGKSHSNLPCWLLPQSEKKDFKHPRVHPC